ncbi:bifunctional 3-oxoadipate enol-lactonase/4-carboxymuconolactone decarboxylase PcaDC [Nocardioides acrostichi]|uniref:4-carboxymuconolactone decarboxylase n=2 Tax=Nocardioides acrostichi TaxID=2784339 RepID=A0A930YAE8_9ACTN|nr:4-carboxymuconolactone decarboxylase [Nocardioides acrostichi]MBF4161333.1 4-carboxymuconolactone decarboxylase [Nocardioides acrostichi]
MTVTLVRLGGRPHLPLLVLGPSLGTSARSLWGDVAARLAGDFQVVGFDLPGHGTHHGAYADHDVASGPPTLSMAALARDVLDAVDVLADTRPGAPPASFDYAGDSVGGCVGLQLLLDAPARVRSAVLLATGARIGTPESWAERVETVLASGTPALVSTSAERWFAPGFLERDGATGSALLHALADAGDLGYAAVCSALGSFDVRERLGEIVAPVLAVAGADDLVTPPAGLRAIAEGVREASYVELADAAHLPPAEQPAEVARLVRNHALGLPFDQPLDQPLDQPHERQSGQNRPSERDTLSVAQVREAGMTVRREVLGDEHVDRAAGRTTGFTRDFQALITEYAWGSIWTRPGLDRRSRSLITLTALVARGHHEELAMHVRAARRNGVTVAEIEELLLQTAIYCGVPDANTAFRIAQQVLVDLGDVDAPAQTLEEPS